MNNDDSIAFSSLRLFCYGFPTSRRFQEDTRACIFCGAPEGDAIEHFVRCEIVLAFAEAHLGAEWHDDPGRLMMLLPLDATAAQRACILHDCILTALRARRAGRQAATGLQLMHGRVRHLRVRRASVRDALPSANPPAL